MNVRTIATATATAIAQKQSTSSGMQHTSLVIGRLGPFLAPLNALAGAAESLQQLREKQQDSKDNSAN